MTEDECKWPLWRAWRKAGVLRADRKDPTRPMRPIGWHVARHSFASHLVMRGVSLKAVQELLGHDDMKTTMRYAHLAPEVRRDAVAVLDLEAHGRGGARSDGVTAP
ncbi:MAG: tyrosine-type recombinase/integrase [Deltaproteobacteria bacterium]|nr:tyrosine-type recombinase/integrase [Deltaproteobacteria bacterium]